MEGIISSRGNVPLAIVCNLDRKLEMVRFVDPADRGDRSFDIVFGKIN